MPFNITISPAQTELIVSPGTTLTQAYSITNNSPTAITLSTSVEAWLPLGSDGAVNYDVPANPSYSFALANADIQLGQTFILSPGQKQQLVLKIRPDTYSPSSDAYFTFFINQSSENTITQYNVNAQNIAKIGSHLLLSTSTAKPSPTLTVNRFSVGPTIKDVFLTQLNFTGQINNSSLYFAKSSGKISLTKGDKIIREIALSPDNVLASYHRTLRCLDLSQDPPSPTACTLSPPFWPGLYQATLTLDANPGATTSVSFFILPLSPLFVVFIFGLLFFTLSKFKSKNHL